MDYNSVLGLKDVKISSLQETPNGLEIVIQKTTSCELCPTCQTPSSSAKNYRTHRIVTEPYKDTPLSTVVLKRCFRCSNPSCSTKFFTEEIEGLAKKHTYTKSFNSFIEDMFKHMDYPTLKKRLSDNYKLSVPSSTIFHKLKDLPLNSNLPPAQLLSPRFIGLDEFSYAKGHSYAVVLINIDKHKIVDTVAGGKTTAAASALLNSIDTSKVEAACIDMWIPYKNAIHNKLPNAAVVIDRFHVIKHINDALKDIIKRIAHTLDKNNFSFLYNSRFTLLKGFEKLSPNELDILSALLSLDQNLATAYNLKEYFRSLYIYVPDKNNARLLLWQWIQLVRKSNIPELVSVANEFASNWITEILNYWQFRISNGLAEGKINKIRTIQRKAYHYINFSSLRYQILKSEL
jgi:transposase